MSHLMSMNNNHLGLVPIQCNWTEAHGSELLSLADPLKPAVHTESVPPGDL